MPKTIVKKCPVCLTDFERPWKRRHQVYCGHKCAFAVFGEKVCDAAHAPDALEKSANSRRGRGTGYVKRGGQHEHPVAMEQKLGRKLRPSEIVHHEDEVKSNNSQDNLILTDRPEHGRIHNLGRKHSPKMTCKNGHSLSGDNIRITSIGRRRCLACSRLYDNAWKKAARNNRRGRSDEGRCT